MSRMITFLTSGTLGDVVPYLVLVVELEQLDFHVCIAAHSPFETTDA